MIRYFRNCLVLIWAGLATAAGACEEAAITLEMRDAIYADDVRRVETLFGIHQGDFETGALRAADMRCLYLNFERSRPETAVFVDDWLKMYPESPFALTAKAWTLWKASWDMRGDDLARKTYPAAMAAFRTMLREGWGYASRAYEANPRLVLASDFMIMAANGVGARARGREVFREVISRDPNRGTYLHARGQLLPGWGHSWRSAVSFCETYAPEFEVEDHDPVLVCKLIVSRSYPDRHDWRIATLKMLDRPDLDYLWLWYLTRPEASAGEAARAHAVMTQEFYYEDKYAVRFDERLARKYGYDFITYDIRERRTALAKELLVHDPYNTTLLKWLIIPVTRPEITEDGRFVWRVVPVLEPEEELELSRRLLVRQPYEHEAWGDYEVAYMKVHEMLPHRVAMAIRTNEVVLSNHRIDVLQSYIGQLIAGYRDYPYYSGERELPAQAKGQAYLLDMYYDGVDRDRDILCPFVRAMRLHDHLCAGTNEPNCAHTDIIDPAFALVQQEVKERGICTVERLRPAMTLGFALVPLPEMD